MAETRIVHNVTDYQERIQREREAAAQLRDREAKKARDTGEVSVELEGWKAERYQELVSTKERQETVTHALNIALGVKALKSLLKHL